MMESDIEAQEIRELETKVSSLERQLKDARMDLQNRRSIHSARLVAKSLENIFGNERIESSFTESRIEDLDLEG